MTAPESRPGAGLDPKRAERRAKLFFYFWLVATMMYAGGFLFMLYIMLFD